jgi:putative transposase
MALQQLRPRVGLILHSAWGSQFAGAAYRQLLASHGLVPSISPPGKSHDAVLIESLSSSLKYELIHHRRFASRTAARTPLFDYIETFHNRSRPHSSLDYVSPWCRVRHPLLRAEQIGAWLTTAI